MFMPQPLGRSSVKKPFRKILQNSHENTCNRVLLSKIADLGNLKNRLHYRCFHVNIGKFSKTVIL